MKKHGNATSKKKIVFALALITCAGLPFFALKFSSMEQRYPLSQELPVKVQSWLSRSPTSEKFREGIAFLKDDKIPATARIVVLDKLHSQRRHLSPDKIKTLEKQFELIASDNAQAPNLRARAAVAMATSLVLMQEQDIIGKTGVEGKFPFLMDIAQDKDNPAAVRGGAIRALGILKAERASAMIAAILSLPSNVNEPELARNSCLALAQIQGDNAVGTIGNVMATTTDETVFGTAAFSLGQMHSPESLVSLVRNKDRFPDSGSADASLANMEDVIFEILRNPEDPDLLFAVKATEHCWKDGQREQYLPLLRSLLDSTSSPVKKAVAERLIRSAENMPLEKRKQELSLIYPAISSNAVLADYKDEIVRLMSAKQLQPSADPVPTTGRSIGNKSNQEYGDAVYRKLVSTSWLGYNYNHAGIFAGQSGGTKRCIEADTFTGDTTIDNPFSSSFSDYDDDYYGAFQLSDKVLKFGQRRAILATAKQVADAYLYYTFFSAVDPITSSRPVEISNIDNIRCDGVVEYCYEVNGNQSWWNTSSPDRWDISLYPDEHNDSPDLSVDPDTEESPWAQRGAPASSSEGPGFDGNNPNNASLNKVAVTANPVCKLSYVQNNENLEITVTATDVSGIARIAYKIGASATWQYTPWQTQYPVSDSYSYKATITNSCVLYYFAQDNGGNFPSSASGISFHTINSTAAAGGTIAPNNRLIAPNGESYTFFAYPDINYLVDKWYVDGNVVQTGGDSYLLSNIQADHSVQATFAYLPPDYSLSVNYGSGDGSYAAGTTIVISADVPIAGKIFDKWTGDTQCLTNIGSASTIVTMPSANIAVTATYKDLPANTYSVMFIAGPGGTVNGTNPQAIVSGGSSAAVRAVPLSGYKFMNWTGTLGFNSGSNPLVVENIKSSMNFTANFTSDIRWDFNSDGKSDIICENIPGEGYAFIMNGLTASSQGYTYRKSDLNWKIHRIADFNGDGKADLFWRNSVTKDTCIYIMNATAISSAKIIYSGKGGWDFKQSGDFNGDGKCDLLVEHEDGTGYICLMNGTSIVSSSYVYRKSNDMWNVTDTGDFNGDGKTDLLWEHSDGTGCIYLMNGINVITAKAIYGKGGNDLHLISLGDFNGDRRTDLLFEQNDGKALIFIMDGVDIVSYGYPYLKSDRKWVVDNSGDFNGDGKTDLLFEHPDGYGAIYLMNGTAISSSAFVYKKSDQNWKILEILDFNGDKKQDLLWEHGLTGSSIIYLMNGSVMSGASAQFKEGFFLPAAE